MASVASSDPYSLDRRNADMMSQWERWDPAGGYLEIRRERESTEHINMTHIHRKRSDQLTLVFNKVSWDSAKAAKLININSKNKVLSKFPSRSRLLINYGQGLTPFSYLGFTSNCFLVCCVSIASSSDMCL